VDGHSVWSIEGERKVAEGMGANLLARQLLKELGIRSRGKSKENAVSER